MTNFTELQDRHLDMMISLAFDQADAEAVQQLLDEPEPAMTLEDQALSKRIFAQAQAKLKEQEKLEKHGKHMLQWKRSLPRILEAAACFVLMLALAMPIAIASSAEFRAKVMQLLVDIDNVNNEAHFGFTENPSAAFDVPAGWTGEYFLSYIPQGMTESWRSNSLPTIEYSSEQNQTFSYSEYNEDARVMAGTENATISYADINGNTAYVIDGVSSGDAIHS
ncbi:MAG: DUF4367 domain-containing protein, partial [Clostridia bacterium]